VLASGYLYSSLIIIPYALTFPGAFAPTGLLGAGPQSAAYLSVSFRLGLAVAIIGYAVLLSSGKHTKDSIELSSRSAIYWSVATVIIVVCVLTMAVTAGHDVMPSLLVNGTVLPLGLYASGLVALMGVLALLLLWLRGQSVLDLWLMVAVCGLTMETGLVAMLMPTRYSFGFYSTRLIPLVVSKVVLITLLSETIALHARLSIANRRLQREHENKLLSAQAAVAAFIHEVGQPLAAMNIGAVVGKRFLDQLPPDIAGAKAHYVKMQEFAFLTNEVFDSFLSLFRGGTREYQSVNMNTLTLEAIQFLQNELDDHNIVVQPSLTPELPDIQGNRGQLREVILNLVQNSIEAMATSTKQRVFSVATAFHSANAISILLQDTGPGIEPSKLASIFDPFFTTKAKGTGLGLAICKMIVEQHGGTLSAASDMKVGARFEVTLPTM
jgi:signal transduction histidine kinase